MQNKRLIAVHCEHVQKCECMCECEAACLRCVRPQVPDVQPVCLSSAEEVGHYEVCRMCVEELALYLKPISGAKGTGSMISVIIVTLVGRVVDVQTT